MEKKQFRVLRKTVWDTIREFPEGHPNEALVLLYLESGPVTDWTGLFSAPVVDIAEATGLNPAEVKAAITNLNGWGHIVYDFDRHMVFVKGLLFRQAKFKPNWKQAEGIRRHLEKFSANSAALRAFFDEHSRTPSLKRLCPKLETHALSDTSGRNGEGYPIGVSKGTPKGTPMQTKNQEPKTNKQQANDAVPSEQTAAVRPPPKLILTTSPEAIPAPNEPDPAPNADDIEATIRAVLSEGGARTVPAGGRIDPRHPNVIAMRKPVFDDDGD